MGMKVPAGVWGTSLDLSRESGKAGGKWELGASGELPDWRPNRETSRSTVHRTP